MPVQLRMISLVVVLVGRLVMITFVKDYFRKIEFLELSVMHWEVI